MAKDKKKLSKNAKAALKVLQESKLLTDAKAAASAPSPKNASPSGAVKTSAANKMRPAKKRG